MPMKYKTQCICQLPEWNNSNNTFMHELHDRYDKCDENHDKEQEISYVLQEHEFDGEFSDVVIWTENENDPTDIEEYDTDIDVKFNCSCGDEIYFGGDGIVVCECGRVYRLNITLQKNDSHKNDIEYWEKIKKEKYKRFLDE